MICSPDSDSVRGGGKACEKWRMYVSTCAHTCESLVQIYSNFEPRQDDVIEKVMPA